MQHFWATTLAAIIAACGLVVALLLLPQPYPDRLAVIPANSTRIDNVGPYDAAEKWEVFGSNAGLHRLNPARVAYFDKRIRSLMRPPFRVLDAGCGGGLVTNALGRLPGYSIDGVDLSRQALRHAEETAVRANLTSVRFASASLYHLPFAGASFDAVIMSDVLEHLLDLRSAIMEAARVLRPGGALLFDTLDRTWVGYVVSILGAERICGLLQPGSHDWRLFIQPKELKKVLELNGFHSFRHEAFNPSFRSVLELALFGAGWLSPSRMRGGWTVSPPSFVMVSYIGLAVKAGAHKVASAPPATAPPPVEWRDEAASTLPATTPPPVEQRDEAASTSPATTPPPVEQRDEAASTSPATTPPPVEQRDEAASTSPATTPPQVEQRDEAASTSPATTPPPVEQRDEATATPLARYQYKVGEEVELRTSGGKVTGAWVKGRIRALGKKPDTYLVFLPGMPENQKEIPWTIPATSLRKLQADLMALKVGDAIEINIERGRFNGSWVPAHITSHGSFSHTYNVRLPTGKPHGFIDVRDIPLRQLRRASLPKQRQEAPARQALDFQVGETVAVKAVQGKAKGSWVKCTILSKGQKPDTFNIRVLIAKPPGYVDIPGVSKRSLSREKVPGRQNSTRRKAEKAPQAALVTSYEVGEHIEVQSTKGSKKGLWFDATVEGMGSMPGKYDLRVRIAGPPGHLQVRDVGTRVMRRKAKPPAPQIQTNVSFEVGEIALIKVSTGPKAGSWVRCLVTGNGSTPNRYAVRVGKQAPPGYFDLTEIPAHALRKSEDALRPVDSFEAGTIAELRIGDGPFKGQWIKCVVVGSGAMEHTYKIRLLVKNLPEFPNVPAQALRRMVQVEPPAAHRPPEEQQPAPHLLEPEDEPEVPMTVFEAGEAAEVRTLEGYWVRCIIGEKGRIRNTYNVRVVADNTEGYLDVPNIPVQRLRKGSRPSRISMILWIFEILFSSMR